MNIMMWFLNLPYDLSEQTVTQRLFKVCVFPLLILMSMVGFFVCLPICAIGAVINYIRGKDKQ